MSTWRHLTRGLRVLVNPKAADQEVSDEVQDYLEKAVDENIARGLSAREARRAALLEIGNTTIAREQIRTYGWENLFGTLLSDLRYAARCLRRSPGFTAVSVLTLALGIGASTAIFSAVNPILFAPLPYPHAGQVMMIWEMRNNGAPAYLSFGNFHGLAERSTSFDAMAVMKPWQPTITGPDEPERLEGQRVSAQYFQTLGVNPVLGSNFQPLDDQLHGPHVVILSDGLWRRRFAADGSIVGRQIQLDDDLYTVIGVMPGSFDNVLAPSAELWAPLQYDLSLVPGSREWGHHLRMIGRLRDGVSRNRARNELNVILPALGQMYPQGYDSTGGLPPGMIVNSLQRDLTQGVRPALLAIAGAVVLLLLIACVNVTNLLLARGSQRKVEFAMRMALGAQPWRLVRQLLTESVLFALLGSIPGMLLTEAGIRVLIALSPPGLPRAGAIRLDGPVCAFAIGLTALVGVIVGLMPALHAIRRDPHSGLQQTTRTTVGRGLTRRTLVVAEVALAMVLLGSAGLLLRSLNRLLAIDPGFEPSHLLTMQVQEAGHRYHADAARARFFEQALEEVRAVPGVSKAAFTSQLPLSGDFESFGVEFEAYPEKINDAALRYAVSPDYFAVMHIPLRSGRLLNENDRPGAPVAVLISESFAKRKFPRGNAVGQRVRIGPALGRSDQPWSTIVGVVGDVKQTSLAMSERDAFYTTNTQWAWVDTAQSLVVHARGDVASLAPTIRKAIWSVDKDEPIVRVATMEKLLAISEAERRFTLALFEVFALAGLALAAIGIYGVLSGSVNERTREIGVRSALGASRANILAMVLRQGMALTILGMLIGLGGAAAANQALSSMLYGISRLDPVTYFGVMALLGGVSVIACWGPARRASRVDPSIALRAE
jgi:putative ABC transport system permease protein